ncbi:hypothetical protein BDK51DRAFT_28135, partial [Blyttiomyces helicus]
AIIAPFAEVVGPRGVDVRSASDMKVETGTESAGAGNAGQSNTVARPGAGKPIGVVPKREMDKSLDAGDSGGRLLERHQILEEGMRSNDDGVLTQEGWGDCRQFVKRQLHFLRGTKIGSMSQRPETSSLRSTSISTYPGMAARRENSVQTLKTFKLLLFLASIDRWFKQVVMTVDSGSRVLTVQAGPGEICWTRPQAYRCTAVSEGTENSMTRRNCDSPLNYGLDDSWGGCLRASITYGDFEMLGELWSAVGLADSIVRAPEPATSGHELCDYDLFSGIPHEERTPIIERGATVFRAKDLRHQIFWTTIIQAYLTQVVAYWWLRVGRTFMTHHPEGSVVGAWVVGSPSG